MRNKLKNINLVSWNNFNFYFCFSKKPWKRVYSLYEANSLLLFHLLFSSSCPSVCPICPSIHPSIHHLTFIHLSHSQLCSYLIQSSTQISQTELTESFGKKATTFSTIFYFSFLFFSLSFSFSSPSSSPVMTCPFKYKSKYYFTYIIQIWKKIWRRQNHP